MLVQAAGSNSDGLCGLPEANMKSKRQDKWKYVLHLGMSLFSIQEAH